MPSSRRQMSATARRFFPPGRARAAPPGRARQTVGPPPCVGSAPAPSEARPAAGTAPARRSHRQGRKGSREVTSRRRFGQARSSSAASATHAWTRRSQLSNATSSCCAGSRRLGWQTGAAGPTASCPPRLSRSASANGRTRFSCRVRHRKRLGGPSTARRLGIGFRSRAAGRPASTAAPYSQPA
jgi:hypothetical protein